MEAIAISLWYVWSKGVAVERTSWVSSLDMVSNSYLSHIWGEKKDVCKDILSNQHGWSFQKPLVWVGTTSIDWVSPFFEVNKTLCTCASTHPWWPLISLQTHLVYTSAAPLNMSMHAVWCSSLSIPAKPNLDKGQWIPQKHRWRLQRCSHWFNIAISFQWT